MPNERQPKCPNLSPSNPWILALTLLLLITGCASNKPSTASTTKPSPFYLGADISTLSQVDRQGGIYMDEGKPGDAIAIFMKNGWTCFRLRIWVDPRNGVNGLEYTTKLAKRIKDAGGTFMLDFHYSDWWADPQKQNKPAAWANLDFDALVNQVESYTSNVIKTLRMPGRRRTLCRLATKSPAAPLWPDAQVKVPLSTVKVFSAM